MQNQDVYGKLKQETYIEGNVWCVIQIGSGMLVCGAQMVENTFIKLGEN